MTTQQIATDLLDIKLTFEQLKQLKYDWRDIGEIHIYKNYQETPLHENTRIHWSDLHCLDKQSSRDDYEAVLTVGMAYFGEYSDGGLVCKANLLYLQDNYSDLPGVKEVIEGMGSETFAVDARLLLLNDPGDYHIYDNLDNLKESLSTLADSALLDDEIYYRLMDEASWEAWTCWIDNDFLRELNKEFEFDTQPFLFSDNQMDKFRDLFYRIVYKECIEFINEQGDSMHIDVEKVVSFVTKEDIQLILKLKE